jgi:hypothetical protein
MKEFDKRESHISSKLRMICVPSNNVRDHVTKTFTNPYITLQRVYTAGEWALTEVT